MDCIATRLPYRETKAFSGITLDYLDQSKSLAGFFAHHPTITGIKKAIAARKAYDEKPGDAYRKTLVEVLLQQYAGRDIHPKVKENIEALVSGKTFTITTAHQNNLFSGPLYFIYKILHAIRLADHLSGTIKDNRFVPVFYMGSEDADIDELNHIHIGGKKIEWKTNQTGAVGRMKIDKDLAKLIQTIEAQLAVLPHGKDYTNILAKHYREGVTIQDATFGFVDELFASYGLIVLIADHQALKKQVAHVMQEDLVDHTPFSIVSKTTERLEAAGYKGQAQSRNVNLFYFIDGVRGRIDREGDNYTVLLPESYSGPAIKFSQEGIVAELQQHPERFSPNVILRGLYQETILPNIVFIGGGGELSYWLQLKDLFDHYKVPYPVLLLRNSFLLIEKKWQEKIQKLGFRIDDIFFKEADLVARIVERESNANTSLNGTLPELEKVYEHVKKQAASIDATLERHVEALKLRNLYRLKELEKKMWRAEKRKYSDQQRQIAAIKQHLFPGNGLQERYDHIGEYYAKFGPAVIDKILQHSPALEQEFVVLNIS